MKCTLPSTGTSLAFPEAASTKAVVARQDRCPDVVCRFLSLHIFHVVCLSTCQCAIHLSLPIIPRGSLRLSLFVLSCRFLLLRLLCSSVFISVYWFLFILVYSSLLILLRQRDFGS
jgi:hypothetical protein